MEGLIWSRRQAFWICQNQPIQLQILRGQYCLENENYLTRNGFVHAPYMYILRRCRDGFGLSGEGCGHSHDGGSLGWRLEERADHKGRMWAFILISLNSFHGEHSWMLCQAKAANSLHGRYERSQGQSVSLNSFRTVMKWFVQAQKCRPWPPEATTMASSGNNLYKIVFFSNEIFPFVMSLKKYNDWHQFLPDPK